MKKEINNYFPKDYNDARFKFKKYSKNLKQESYKVHQDLTINISYTNRKSNTLFIILTGVHGVEGYIGSAFLNYFIDNNLKNIKNIDFLFIHSLNPYGFNYNRRVNENNIDLNRNALKNFKDLEKKYPDIYKIINKSQFVIGAKRPRKFYYLKNFLYYLFIIKNIIIYGFKKTITAATFGQNKYPKSIEYCGKSKEKSILIFENIINKFTNKYHNSFLFDIHTGAGKKYKTLAFTNIPPTTKEYEILKNLEPNLKYRLDAAHLGSEHIGSIGELFLEKSKSKNNFELTFEFGTVSIFSNKISANHLSHVLVAENQITHYGPKNKLYKTREKLKKLYYPDSYYFKKYVIKKVNKISKNLQKIEKEIN